jgi:ring-1,2-phenylacetyl-CoA epoxidase subunit PaaD
MGSGSYKLHARLSLHVHAATGAATGAAIIQQKQPPGGYTSREVGARWSWRLLHARTVLLDHVATGAAVKTPGAATRADGPIALNLLPTKRALTCPRCGSAAAELTSEFGPTACKALYRCTDCLEPFEHVKEI